jgi:NitT/TauT family transport system permease protein
MATMKAMQDMYQSGIVTDLMNSLLLNLTAIPFYISISIGFAYLYTIPFFKPIVLALCKLRFLSLVGLTFFFTQATNNQHQLKVALLVFSVSVFFITSMLDVVMSIPKAQYDLGRTIRLNNWQLLKEVVIYGQVDKAFDVFRQNAAIGWMMLTMIEGLAKADGGVGAALLSADRYFHLANILAIQLTILGLGLTQDYLIGVIKNIVCPYSQLTLDH